MAVFWCVNCWVLVSGGGRCNIEAMEIRMILLENLIIQGFIALQTSWFFYPIFCLHRKQLQRIARYSIALDHFFVSAFTMKEDKQTEKFWSIFVWDNIYTTIDTILCLVLIRWKIFQGIYINWHPEMEKDGILASTYLNYMGVPSYSILIELKKETVLKCTH